jgi:hypothetical protein
VLGKLAGLFVRGYVGIVLIDGGQGNLAFV